MNTAKEIIKDTDTKMRKSVDSTKREFMEVRTGRAHAGLIEGLHVDYFGTNMRFRDLASINVPDAATVIIQPWDPTVIPELEKSINNSALGITPQNDGKMIRLVVPPLSKERREEMKKIVKDMAEKGRISLRTVRRDANEKIKKLAAEKKVSEDEDKRSHDEIQKMTDKFIKEIDDLLVDKTKQLEH
jgi:ribosome recycling factor